MIRTHVHGWDFSPGHLLTITEVARMFGVSGATVTRWAVEGKLASVRTLGGHRRFSREQVEYLLRHGPS
ncbi:helix-turn-helix domain-containing protein [Actinomadura spongiicola]|nr:helix-turn-helix domain-containing protein [Actinomadura spongiicola]